MAKKWTMTRINKMTKEEMIDLIEKTKGFEYIYTRASKEDLKRELIILINKGLV